jgi:hypothetical protein
MGENTCDVRTDIKHAGRNDENLPLHSAHNWFASSTIRENTKFKQLSTSLIPAKVTGT